ncbi:MAG: hypothetical protein IJQ21_01155 [Lachnospiraceae bacterium]|nr:hypothetical protein [Lachnospiraceae bacterium]
MRFHTLGFPVINNFPGDIREFTPSLFAYLDGFDIVPVLEEGYGKRLGYSKQDYLDASAKVIFKERRDVFSQDILITLKNPENEDLEQLRDGSGLFSMIHYHTRPQCVKLINRKQLKSFSMDSMVDDRGIRTFVDYFGTAFAGSETAFGVLKEIRKDFDDDERKPFVVTIVGAGGVAQGCVRSMEVLSDRELFAKHLPGLITQVITRSVTEDDRALRRVLKDTDILVDATNRPDSTVFIITNDQLGELKEQAIILDLAADRYDTSIDPPQVKAFEGTIKGTPDNMIRKTDDPDYEAVPKSVSTKNRRLTVSCDAWPSVHPKESIEFYQILMKNYLNILLTKDTDELDINSNDTFERSLCRSSIGYFNAHNK